MSEFYVLDGGMATELARQGFNYDSDPLWSARAIDEHPEAISKVSLSFLEHGADVVSTNTYQASVKGFQDYLGKNKTEAEELISIAAKVATETRDDFWKMYNNQNTHVERMKPLVVGSVGPYGACLHDGSEYTGDYVEQISIQELQNWHRSRLKILVDSGIDMIAFETIPAQKEAESLSLLLNEFPECKAWMSFSCKDGQQTCHGESFAEAVFSVIKCSTQIVAVGVNCCSPEIIKPLLESIHGRIDLPLVVYPNSGEEWKDGRWHTTNNCESIASHVPEWVKLGARWIGGCCRTTPFDIAEIRNSLYSCSRRE